MSQMALHKRKITTKFAHVERHSRTSSSNNSKTRVRKRRIQNDSSQANMSKRVQTTHSRRTVPNEPFQVNTPKTKLPNKAQQSAHANKTQTEFVKRRSKHESGHMDKSVENTRTTSSMRQFLREAFQAKITAKDLNGTFPSDGSQAEVPS